MIKTSDFLASKWSLFFVFACGGQRLRRPAARELKGAIFLSKQVHTLTFDPNTPMFYLKLHRGYPEIDQGYPDSRPFKYWQRRQIPTSIIQHMRLIVCVCVCVCVCSDMRTSHVPYMHPIHMLMCVRTLRTCT